MVQADLEAQLVNVDRLAPFLNERIEGDGPLSVMRHIAGHSNETFFVSRGEHHWVLRRPPLAVYLPTAHDVLREARVLKALSPTAVRVPRVMLVCEDASIIGAPFYLMEKVQGSVLRSDIPSAIDNPADRRRVAEELVRSLAELHSVDPPSVGLESFGKPHGYLERQVRRWTGQLELATSVTTSTRELPDMWMVRDWLTTNLPDEVVGSVVHGDYKLDNVIFGDESPAHLSAILDWEMSTLGDPFADLGWLISLWRQKDDPPDPLHDELARITSAEGFPSRAELVEMYSEFSGRRVPDLTWYVVAAIWKLACLLEGSFGRHLMGTTDDPFFARLEWGVPALAKSALDIAAGGSF